MDMETAPDPYLVPKHPEPPTPTKPSQGAGGAMWGWIFGMLGGAASAVVLAVVLAVGTLVESGEFDDVPAVFILLATIGGVVGAIAGGILGVVAGLLLGLFRLERFARWVTAALCAMPPLLVAKSITEEPQFDQPDLVLALICAGLFAIIGYFTGRAFERRLVEDAKWLPTT